MGISLLGIFLTAKPDVILGYSSSSETVNQSRLIIGLLAGLGSALCNAISIISLRKLRKVPHEIIIISSNLTTSLEMLLISYFTKSFDSFDCSLPWYVLAIGLISFTSQAFFIRASQVENANIVSMTESIFDFVFGFAFQMLFFHELPDSLTVVGSILIGIAVLFLSLQKYLLTLPARSPLREIFKWTLR